MSHTSTSESTDISQDKIARVSVLSKTTWTPTLFSFTVSRPDSFKFTAGQFVRLGVNPSRLMYNQKVDTQTIVAEDIFRPYSIVSSPYDDVLEFFSIVIEDGAFTSQLQHLKVGDELLLDKTPFGFLTLARYQKPDPTELWLLATGTGVAPFLSMLQDLETWKNYERIVLAYSARDQSELAYTDLIHRLQSDFGSLVDNAADFMFIPVITREDVPNTLNERLPKLISSGALEAKANLEFDVSRSHVMLCGNPQMVDDTKAALKEKGLVMNRRGEGNIAVENYW